MLFTAVTYVLLFVSAGVISIYAYDASLSDPSTELELISLVPPVVSEVKPAPPHPRRPSPPAGASSGPRSERPVLIDQINNPLNPPDKPSAIASTILPAHAGTYIGPVVIEPSGSGLPNGGGTTPGGTGNVPIVPIPDPPPAPTPTPAPRIITSPRVLNSEAISLPKPPYPDVAKKIGAQGAVNVQVLIDETGRVISARAISGSPLLKGAAQHAATQARFSPTMLGDQAVKVSGVITYNFVLQ